MHTHKFDDLTDSTMLASGQLSTLTEMGISVWELRSQSTSNELDTKLIETKDTEFHDPLPAVDCLMVVEEHDDSVETQRLLHAMLFSIGLTPNNSAIVSPGQLSQLKTSSTQHKILVAFGDQLVPQAISLQAMDRGHIYSSLDLGLKIIISLSLTALLKSPDKKALAWQDLQLVKKAYSSEDLS